MTKTTRAVSSPTIMLRIIHVRGQSVEEFSSLDPGKQPNNFGNPEKNELLNSKIKAREIEEMRRKCEENRLSFREVMKIETGKEAMANLTEEYMEKFNKRNAEKNGEEEPEAKKAKVEEEKTEEKPAETEEKAEEQTEKEEEPEKGKEEMEN